MSTSRIIIIEAEGSAAAVAAALEAFNQVLDAAAVLPPPSPPAAPLPSPLTMAAITDCVARFYGIPLVAIKSQTRRRSVARARQICMYFTRRKTKCSFDEIGRFFGHRDHTTVMHAVRTVAADRAARGFFGCQIDDIEALLSPSSVSEQVGSPVKPPLKVKEDPCSPSP